MQTMESSPNAEQPRRLRLIMIGAGVSGILMAYKIRKYLSKYVDFVIYEKSPEIGGTWFENRYPGCACDVPSHVYQFSFAPNPSWSKYYAPSQEIHAYLKNVCHEYDLNGFMCLNSKVISAVWSEDTSKWTVTIEDGRTDECDVLINAGGILNNPNVPSIEGLSHFGGPVLHTAAWDPDADLSSKRVAVIGAGASAIQLLPQIQPLASQVDVYIRTPSWISPPVALNHRLPSTTASSQSLTSDERRNPHYTPEEMQQYRNDPAAYLATRKTLEAHFNGMFGVFTKNSAAQRNLRAEFDAGMRELIASPELREKLIPDFEVGCRRINPGEAYLEALQKENVRPVFDSIHSVEETGVVVEGRTPSEKHSLPADVLVLATGFNTSFVPRFAIVGKGGVDLRDLWSPKNGGEPISYMGTGISGFPNYLTFLGPNTPISNGSIMGTLESTSDYFVRLIRKMLRQDVKSFDVRADAQADFDEHTQGYMKDMVWTGNCRSWFKKGTDGRVSALWPGSTLHYMQTLAEDRWEDYNWTHRRHGGNRFAYWGPGLSWIEDPSADHHGREDTADREKMASLPHSGADLSFYMTQGVALPARKMPESTMAPVYDVVENKLGGQVSVVTEPVMVAT